MNMIADIIVLALVIAYGVFVISYLYSRKKQGLSCVGCAGTHVQVAVAAAAPVIVPAAQAAVECISNQEVELSWQMQLLSLLLSLLCCLPGKGAYKHLKGEGACCGGRKQAGDSEEEAGWNQAGRENHEDHRYAL